MRKDLLCLTIIAVVVFSCTDSSTSTEPSKELPNIVFIFTDDLGYGDLSCFGATDISTPAIDRIASQGIKFTEFYSASPVCSPSRAGLLTGRMPQRMGINQVFFPESLTGMPQEEITIAEVLRDKGYHTGIVGKWHLGHMEKYLPLNQGFDEYFGIPYSNDMASVVYMRGNEVETFDVDQRYTTKTYTEEALSFIDQHADQPFYLYIAHNMPHVPIYASPEFEGTSERGLYGDVIQEIDWSVEMVLDKLEEKGILENTLVVFSSDNGPWLVMEDHGGSAGILREGKQYTFEGGVRVPTVAMWKGTIPEGQVYDDIASQMDWFPTFCNLVGAEVPDDRPIDGVDITNVLFNEGKRKQREFLFYMGADQRAYRNGDWKVKRPFSGRRGTPWSSGVPPHDTLLIDLKKDPSEAVNLASSESERLSWMYQRMDSAVLALDSLPPSLVVRTPGDQSHLEYLREKHNNDND